MKIDYFGIINTFVNNTKTSGVTNEGINETLKTISDAKNTAQTNTSATLLNQNQEVKFNLINRMELSKFIKDLIKLPGEIEELLSFLTYNKISNETLQNLLKQNQKINTDIIKQLLEESSKESLNKLLKLFQQAPGGTQNTAQIKNILNLLSQLIPKKELSPQELLTNLTLLYLPWLPLAEKQDLRIQFEKHKNQEEEDESEQTALVIYITTINLGKFMISILLEQNSSIKIEIENSDEKKNEKNKEYLEKILKEINEQTKQDKINAKTELIVISGAKEPSEENKREVIISPAKDVSPILIITAQKIAKIILETDEKISLLERREEMAK